MKSAEYRMGTPITAIEYTANELRTWNTCLTHLLQLFPTHACAKYNEIRLDMFEQCGYQLDHIPQLDVVSNYVHGMVELFILTCSTKRSISHPQSAPAFAYVPSVDCCHREPFSPVSVFVSIMLHSTYGMDRVRFTHPSRMSVMSCWAICRCLRIPSLQTL